MNESIIKGIFTTFLTTLSFLFGGWDIGLQTLIVIIIIDYITGIIASAKKGKLSSKTGLNGILKKLGYLCLVALAVLIDRLTNANGLVRNFIIYYIIANEGLSILENLGKAGVPVPEFLKKILLQLKKDNEENQKG